MQNYLPACKIVSTHGVRGEMKALPLRDGAAFLAKFKRLFTTADGAGETRVLGVRAQGNVILLRLDGVNDMDAARAYGRLTNVDRPAAQDIYTVTDTAGGEHMLPAVPEFVKNIDIEARKILVTPIEGMFTEAVNGDED